MLSRRCSARQCSRTRLLAMPSSQARAGPWAGLSCAGVGTQWQRPRRPGRRPIGAQARAMKRCTTAKLTSKHCSKSASPTTGLLSGAPAWPWLGPLTLNDCQFARHMFPARTKCWTPLAQHGSAKLGPALALARSSRHPTRSRNKVWSRMRELCPSRAGVDILLPGVPHEALPALQPNRDVAARLLRQ